MKLKIATYLALASVPLMVGCYDEGNKEDCVGLKCPNGFQWPEGGEVRIWTIRLPDGAVITRYFGFFIESQSPDDPLPLPLLGVCGREVTADQGENAVYIDMGPSLTFDLENGASVEVPRLLPDPAVTECMPGTACAAGVIDFYGRRHDVAYLLETFEGTGTAPGFYDSFTTVQAQEQTSFSDDLGGLYLGPSFTMLAPPQDENAVATFRRGEDVEFAWENEQAPNPDVVAAAAIVFVPDVATQATACLSLNDGNFVVPAETIDALEDDTGIVLVGNGADEAILTEDGRIVHKWGQFCNLIPWQRVD